MIKWHGKRLSRAVSKFDGEGDNELATKLADERRQEIYLTLRALGYEHIPKPIVFSRSGGQTRLVREVDLVGVR